MDKRKFFKKSDFIIIGAVLLTGILLLIFMPRAEGSYAVVMYNGSEIERLPLNEDTVYNPPVNEAVEIEIKEGRVHFKHSDCPDKICVNTGWLSKSGQSAVCLPNRLSVIVEGGKKSSIEGEI